MAKFNCTIYIKKEEDGFYLVKIKKRNNDSDKPEWYLFPEDKQHQDYHGNIFKIEKVLKITEVMTRKRDK